MKAEVAAKIVNEGTYEGQDFDELYAALQNNAQYAAEFSKLLQRLGDQVLLDMKKLQDVSTAAETLTILDEAPAQLDEETLGKLNALEFTEPREVKGKVFNAKVSPAKQKQIVQSIIGAARMDTMRELRGMVSPESKAAQAFRVADPKQRAEIYNNTLRQNVDAALVTIILGHEATEKFNAYNERSAQITDEKARKAEEEKFLSSLHKDVQKNMAALGNLGKNGGKARVGLENAAAYCTTVYVRSQEDLKTYKNHIADRFAKIDKILAYLTSEQSKKAQKNLAKKDENLARQISETSERMEKTWGNYKAALRKKFDECDAKVSLGLAKMENTGKIVFGQLWNVTKQVAKGAWEKKYQIAADVGAAMAYSAVLGSGLGAVATVGAGAAYGAYTIWRRVVKPAKEYKQKGKKLDAKFWVKSAVGIGAAYMGFSVAQQVAGMKDLSGVALEEAAKALAAQRANKVMLTTGGAISANVAGVVQAAIAKDKKQTKAELLQTVFTAALSGTTAWLSSHLGGNNAVENNNENMNDSVAETPVAEKGAVETETPENSAEGTDVAENDAAEGSDVSENDGKETYTPEEDYPWDFPDHNPENSGITDRQFENIRNIIMRHTNGDETLLDRMYHNAAANAASLSMDPDNPMTPEQVLFKFFRASAWTNNMRSNGWAFSETGAFGKELKAVFDALACDDKVPDGLLERAVAVLNTINPNGSMDASKAFALCPELEKYNEVAADGSIVGKTNNVLTGIHEDPCATDKEVEFTKGASNNAPVNEPQAEPETNEVKTEPVENTSKPDKVIDREEVQKPQENVVTRAEPEPTPEEKPNLAVGAGNYEGLDAGDAAANDANDVANGNGAENLSPAEQRALWRSMRRNPNLLPEERDKYKRLMQGMGRGR